MMTGCPIRAPVSSVPVFCPITTFATEMAAAVPMNRRPSSQPMSSVAM
jgi:hypothetical protein